MDQGPSAADAARASTAQRSPRAVLVTAANAGFAPLLQGMLRSLDAFPESVGIDLAVFDTGLAPAQRGSLLARGARLLTPRGHLGVDAAGQDPVLLSFLARPFLREYLPGYDVYLWIDSDVWLQRWDPVARFVGGALSRGLAVAHERERGYRFQAWLFGWTAKHMLLGYGPADAAWLLTRRHVNAGVFALRADAPHWRAWAARYAAAIARSGALVPHDQFALNHAIHGGLGGRGALPAALLPPGDNWICDRGVPMWNDTERAFCEPYPPYRVIGALHLAGPAKRTEYEIRRTGGGSFRARLVQGAAPPAG